MGWYTIGSTDQSFLDKGAFLQTATVPWGWPFSDSLAARAL